MIDKIDSIINYEIQEQLEYMIQDAFGKSSFDELEASDIALLKEKIEDLNGGIIVSELRYMIDRWEEDNVQ
jgi:C4-type Zn-finger protein